jgi:hypothetical protein
VERRGRLIGNVDSFNRGASLGRKRVNMPKPEDKPCDPQADGLAGVAACGEHVDAPCEDARERAGARVGGVADGLDVGGGGGEPPGVTHSARRLLRGHTMASP